MHPTIRVLHPSKRPRCASSKQCPPNLQYSSLSHTRLAVSLQRQICWSSYMSRTRPRWKVEASNYEGIPIQLSAKTLGRLSGELKDWGRDFRFPLLSDPSTTFDMRQAKNKKEVRTVKSVYNVKNRLNINGTSTSNIWKSIQLDLPSASMVGVTLMGFKVLCLMGLSELLPFSRRTVRWLQKHFLKKSIFFWTLVNEVLSGPRMPGEKQPLSIFRGKT